MSSQVDRPPTLSELGSTVASTSPSAIRFKGMWISLAIGAGLQTLVALGLRENLTYSAFVTVFVVVPLTALLLLLWWTFWSGLRVRARAAGWMLVLAAFGIFVALFRFDEFDGAMIPRFSPRWRATGLSRAEQYFREKTPAARADDPATQSTNSAASSEIPTPAESDSPAFRGANRDAVVLGVQLPPGWGTTPPRALWRHPIGLGWGAFAVIGSRAWTQEQRGPEEIVACYDVETGTEIWTHADSARFESVQGGDGPRGTPTVDAGRVYSHGATGLLNCLDGVTGKRIWSVNSLTDSGSENLPWGQACSPLIVEDLVIVSPGSNNDAAKAKKAAVIAYRKETGEKVWTAEDRFGTYVSPQLATLGGEPFVLIFDGVGALGLDPKTGERRWSFDWSGTSIKGSQPLVIDDQRVLFGAGYGVGSVLIDVTKLDTNKQATSLWTSRQFKLKFNGAVRRGEHLFGLDEGVLTCLSLKDGKRLWKQGRFGFGQLLLVDDTLLILSEEGDVVLIPATPQPPREKARFHAIDGKTWNHPVLIPGRLLVRNSEEAACYEVTSATGTKSKL